MATVLIVYRNRHVVEIEGGGITEHDELDQRWADENRPASSVTQDRQQLLDDECEDLPRHGRQSSRLRALARAKPRKIAAITTSAAALGRMIDLISPAKNTDCRMATK